MENISHSVIGMAAGLLLQRSFQPEPDAGRQRTRQRLLVLSCWLASNFPDVDLLLTHTLPAPLGYLLQHRGYTHTLGYLLPQALLIGGVLLLWPGARRLLRESARARWGVLVSVLLGLLLHLSLDALNSYGIHPFYPLTGRWWYGDAVFIVEPVFWVLFGIPVLLLLTRGFWRVPGVLLLLGVPLYATWHGFLAWPSLVFLLVCATLMAVLQRRAGEQGRGALSLAFVLALVFIGGQSVAGQVAWATVARYSAQHNGGERIVDIALTPFPTNPLCWNAISLTSDEANGRYRLRQMLVSNAPAWLHEQAWSCPARLVLQKPVLDTSSGIIVFSSQDYRLAALRNLQQHNCYFAAWMRFARLPVLNAREASDLRFEHGPEGNFSTLPWADLQTRPCPNGVPPWGMPRADLLVILQR